MKTKDIGGGKLETWSVDEVGKAWKADEIVIIDVRTPQEYMFEHVGGALLMPMPFFDATKLPGQSDKRIVLMCGSDTRSGKMAKAALEAGIDRIAHLEGGFAAWKEAGLAYIGTDMSTGGPKDMPEPADG